MSFLTDWDPLGIAPPATPGGTPSNSEHAALQRSVEAFIADAQSLPMLVGRRVSRKTAASLGASEKEAFLDFRVTLQPIDKRTKMKTQAAPMVFAERSRFRKVGDAWLYASGEVTSEEAGLKGAVLNGQRDLTKLEKDVEYVKGVLGEDSPFK